jgi:hypothetical protein|tara:strand:- start:646 stop:948 length:303 start_codon:yes stop_codon:yes gene_type:complete
MILSEWKRLSEDFGETVSAEHSADIVNEPTHYARWKIEPITYIMRNGFEFWRGNLIKYSSRAGFKLYDGKTQVESEVIDLEKVIRYANMRINQLNGEEKL